MFFNADATRQLAVLSLEQWLQGLLPLATARWCGLVSKGELNESWAGPPLPRPAHQSALDAAKLCRVCSQLSIIFHRISAAVASP